MWIEIWQHYKLIYKQKSAEAFHIGSFYLTIMIIALDEYKTVMLDYESLIFTSSLEQTCKIKF